MWTRRQAAEGQARSDADSHRLEIREILELGHLLGSVGACAAGFRPQTPAVQLAFSSRPSLAPTALARAFKGLMARPPRPSPTHRPTSDRVELLPSKLSTDRSLEPPEPQHRPVPPTGFMARLPVGFRPADATRHEQALSQRTVAARRRDLALSYGVDWVLAIGLLVAFACVGRSLGPADAQPHRPDRGLSTAILAG